MQRMIAFLCILQVSVCQSLMRLEGHKNLTRIYAEYDEGPGLHHWMEYGQFYDSNIRHMMHRLSPHEKVNMLEIGVQSGGTTRVWKQYFGRRLQYIGIDINPGCAQFASESEGIRIEIGSQTDVAFLNRVCKQYGPFHLIVDDGAHTTQTIITSLGVLWDCLHDGGVYGIEDLHTMTQWAGRDSMVVEGKDVYGHLAEILRGMEAYKYTGRTQATPAITPANRFSAHLAEVRAYDSAVFLHYRAVWKPLTEFRRGKVFIPYNATGVAPPPAQAARSA